ncbi:MAG: transposase [Pyrinomonadaceae bacterium]|nr:transposase [Pyrinomonadaceae bacterium]
MSRKQYPITREDVQRHTARVCQQYIPLKDHGKKTTAAALWAVLCYACARITSLADACKSLRDAPSDTAAHTALLATLPHIVPLQQCINRALQGDLPKSLRKRKQPLSIDLTLNAYHGQPLHSADEIYRSQAKHGTTHFHAYATAYVTRKGQRYTLALVYVRAGQPLKEVIQELLRQAARCGVRPRYLLLDKGFCSVEVIRYLQRGRYPFLMPLVLRGRKANHPKGPSASQVFATWKKSGWGRYTMTSSKKERATVQVCVKCRNLRGERGKHGREALVYAFGGGLAPGSFQWVKETYRKRFGIETSYRQMREARIKTCTRDPLLRLLYVGLALILRNVWVWLHWQVLSQPRRGGRRLDLAQLSFRGMLLWLQHYAEEWLGRVDEIQAQRPFPT